MHYDTGILSRMAADTGSDEPEVSMVSADGYWEVHRPTVMSVSLAHGHGGTMAADACLRKLGATLPGDDEAAPAPELTAALAAAEALGRSRLGWLGLSHKAEVSDLTAAMAAMECTCAAARKDASAAYARVDAITALFMAREKEAREHRLLRGRLRDEIAGMAERLAKPWNAR